VSTQLIEKYLRKHVCGHASFVMNCPIKFGLILIAYFIVHVTNFVAISSQGIKIFATDQT